jgi:beta-aspartyl-peptidase (threonine type)
MEPVIAIHGGAGTIRKKNMTPEREAAYRKGLEDALAIGSEMLLKGSSALDAVEAAVRSLEDCPLFNAGRGSVFTAAGGFEMDAAIMEGRELTAGSVAGVSGVLHPISLARKVPENSPHVMLSGQGAYEFARKVGAELASHEDLFDAYRHQQWLRVKGKESVHLDHTEDLAEENRKFGTVGAVALDRHGDLAAATSTGGMTNKRYGRIGDSPLIGIGTYANNETCAVSCTGHGEPFIRAVAAYDLSCLMAYRGMSLAEAARYLVHEKLVSLQADGGLIAVDGLGNVALPFNTEGMYRAYRIGEAEQVVKIY